MGTQLQRFVDAGGDEDDGGEAAAPGGGVGWERAVGGDMNAVYEHLLAPADRER